MAHEQQGFHHRVHPGQITGFMVLLYVSTTITQKHHHMQGAYFMKVIYYQPL